MTWGIQNSEEEAHSQLDFAVKEHGVNFIDTAELYPVPTTASNWQPGTTENYIGTWLSKNPSSRSELVIATKVTGFFPNSKVAAARYEPQLPEGSWPDGRTDAKSVKEACDASLRRLQTDYIDLYQVHWPDRYVPIFGNTQYDPSKERPDSIPIRETAAVMKELLDAGKIKAYGISNETSYGLAEWVRAADELGMPRPASIQNAFSLLVRQFEGELAEACAQSNYNVGLLPWSVLCGGLLSGKYRADAPEPVSKNARFMQFPNFMSRWSPPSCGEGANASKQVLDAVDTYAHIAEEQGMNLAEASIDWCRTRSCMKHGSVIVGGTSVEQLKTNLEVFHQPPRLSEEALAAIDEMHALCPNPGTAL